MTTSITDQPRRTIKKKSLINILTQFRLKKINLKHNNSNNGYQNIENRKGSHGYISLGKLADKPIESSIEYNILLQKSKGSSSIRLTILYWVSITRKMSMTNGALLKSNI